VRKSYVILSLYPLDGVGPSTLMSDLGVWARKSQRLKRKLPSATICIGGGYTRSVRNSLGGIPSNYGRGIRVFG